MADCLEQASRWYEVYCCEFEPQSGWTWGWVVLLFQVIHVLEPKNIHKCTLWRIYFHIKQGKQKWTRERSFTGLVLQYVYTFNAGTPLTMLKDIVKVDMLAFKCYNKMKWSTSNVQVIHKNTISIIALLHKIFTYSLLNTVDTRNFASIWIVRVPY